MENENRGIKRIKGERELEEAWLELGRAYDPPLWDTMDDYGSYLSKVADAAITLVCVDGHRTIGGISFYANDCESRRAFITQLMVLPECQGEGVGTARGMRRVSSADFHGETSARSAEGELRRKKAL